MYSVATKTRVYSLSMRTAEKRALHGVLLSGSRTLMKFPPILNGEFWHDSSVYKTCFSLHGSLWTFFTVLLPQGCSLARVSMHRVMLLQPLAVKQRMKSR